MNTKPTYEELLAENARLKALLDQHGISYVVSSESAVPATSTRQEKPKFAVPDFPAVNLSLNERVELFQSLFRGREDVFARRWYSVKTERSGYQPVCLNEWKQGICDKKKFKCADCPNRLFKALEYGDFYRHLVGSDPNGQDVIGIYAIREDNTCLFLCADFDDKSCEHGYEKDVLAYVSECKEWNIPCYIERSRSGNGAHVWIFFDTPVLAYKARKLGFAILTEAMNREGRMSFKSYDRFFPNQDRIPEGGFGNLVALPLQGQARKKGNSVYVNEDFLVYADQWSFLASFQKVTAYHLEGLVNRYATSNEPLGELSSSKESAPWETPASQTISKADFPSKLTIVKSNMLYIPLDGLKAKAVNHLKRIAAFRNPEFYAKQAMRLPVYNIPRIISCADVLDDYVALPRGCEDAVTDLLEFHNVKFEIEDKRQKGKPIVATFKGEPFQNQKEAIEALTQYNNGVLNGTTAFGKTITAIALIAKLRVNTLILVHTKALLDQWQQKLTEFLNLEYEEPEKKGRGRRKAFSPFGTLDSRGNSLHGQVDIALMQSCFDGDEVKPFVRDYGMVIVDECHHVSAFSFEQILRQVNAKYVYGLTATPIRKDGHQPIIFMQCGPIRYSADAKTQKATQTFDRILIPRFTSYRHLEEKATFAQMTPKMAEDDMRNEMIVKDVVDTLEDGRSPIVLTSLTAHVSILADLLRTHCKNVITLVGSESTKEKREKMELLNSIPANEPMVIVATGKYVGEGFDCPRLDTLFMALPVSWKGIVAQYAGRLHREYPTKKDVRIYDYIDFHVPMFDQMFRRRMKGYSAIGYEVRSEENTGLFAEEKGIIFDGKSYLRPLMTDLKNAKQSIIFAAPKLWFSINSPILDTIKELSAKGIEVVAFVKTQTDHDTALMRAGAKINYSDKQTLTATIIDKSIVWYGSINPVGFNSADDTAIKLTDPTIAGEIIETLYSNVNTENHG